MARFEQGCLVFRKGDWVTWRHTRVGQRQAEGIDAAVEIVIGDRVQVRIAQQVRGRFQKERRRVRARALIPRSKPAPVDSLSEQGPGEQTDAEGVGSSNAGCSDRTIGRAFRP